MSVAVAGFGFLQGWSPILAVLIIGRVGVGLGFAATMAPRALMLQQWSTQRRIALTNGAWVSGVDVVMGVGFLVTPFVLAWVGSWQGVYYFWGFVSLGLAALWLVFGKERSTGEYRQRMATQQGSPLTVFRKYPELWIVGLGMFGGMTANTGFQTFWPRLAARAVKHRPEDRSPHSCFPGLCHRTPWIPRQRRPSFRRQAAPDTRLWRTRRHRFLHQPPVRHRHAGCSPSGYWGGNIPGLFPRPDDHGIPAPGSQTPRSWCRTYFHRDLHLGRRCARAPCCRFRGGSHR